MKPFFVLARDFPQWNQSQLFVEFGLKWVDRIRTPHETATTQVDSLFWNIGGFLPIRAWRATLEINGRNNQWNGGNRNEIFLTPGIIYKLSKEWEIGLGIPVGLNNTTDNYRMIGYLMWEFDLVNRESNYSVKID